MTRKIHGLQGRGEGPRSVVSGKQPPIQRQQNQGDDRGLQKTTEGASPYPHQREKVEKVKCFKFLGVHITDKLKWSTHTDSLVKKAQQCLRRLKKFVSSPKTQTLTDAQSRASCWSVSPPGTTTAPPTTRKALQRVVRSAQRIPKGKLPALQDTYSTPCHRKAKKIIKDNNHLSHCLFTPLSSRRRGNHAQNEQYGWWHFHAEGSCQDEPAGRIPNEGGRCLPYNAQR
ncbi:uncharacterized protein LOC127907695 [Oncorhynchus keta]|uniref:uncharacterized protein LOC127907695 n=1 Tax=Oncorhynchus keta TaxID=8018 RepID=UPI002279F670|nr:uncharacterized protein LOC127907695 [Oncorhynchus keta]